MDRDYFKKIDVISFDYFRDFQFKPSACLRMNQALGEAYGILNGASVQALAPKGVVLMLSNIVLEFGDKKPMESEIKGEMWLNNPQGRLLSNSMRFTNSNNDYLFGFTNYYMVVDEMCIRDSATRLSLTGGTFLAPLFTF